MTELRMCLISDSCTEVIFVRYEYNGKEENGKDKVIKKYQQTACEQTS
jgi:hypothetical protein